MSTGLTAVGLTHAVSLPSGPRLELLRDVSFEVPAGSSLAVMGRSGSGKTTLLSILGLLSPPDDGEVLIDGAAATGLDDRRQAGIRNGRIGFVFQSPSLIPHMSAAENVALPLLHGAGVGRRERAGRTASAMELAQISHRAASRPRQLSGGEQQRVAIARALVRSPAVIIADEPTGALDTGTAETVLQALLDAARTRDVALVLATHDPAVARRADRAGSLADSRMTPLGSDA